MQTTTALAANHRPSAAHQRPHVAVNAAAAVAKPQGVNRIMQTLQLLEKHVPMTRRIVHAGDAVFRVGDALDCLCVIHSGVFKTVNLAPDGREHVVGLHFKGDWLGLDGIAKLQHGCDAVALDIGEVWCIRYATLLAACAKEPALLSLMHAAMSREIGRDRESMLSLCTLPADARVAEFLRHWAEALAECGVRTDQITLRMTRAEIGNYLGMKLETVSRALSRLARDKVIGFGNGNRRDVLIPDVDALSDFVQASLLVSERETMLQ